MEKGKTTGVIDTKVAELVSDGLTSERREQLRMELEAMNVDVNLEVSKLGYQVLKNGDNDIIYVQPIDEVTNAKTGVIIKIDPQVSHVNAVKEGVRTERARAIHKSFGKQPK